MDTLKDNHVIFDIPKLKLTQQMGDFIINIYMDNDKLKQLYFDLRDLRGDFVLSIGGKNKNLRNAAEKKRSEIIQKVKRMIESNDELLEIIHTCPSYTFQDQDFFVDRYFASDMSDFLEKVNEKYRFTL